MQIQDMTAGLREGLREMWVLNEQRLPDNLRDPDWIDVFLFEDQGATQLYVVDDKPTLLVVGDIQPGLSASVLMLSHEEAEVGELVHEMREIIAEMDLKRLTANVPSPVKDVQRTLEAVGFRREGHLRRSMFFNDRLVGTDIYGLYRDPSRERVKKQKNGNGKAQQA